MFDINKENTDRIVKFCNQNGVKVIGKIPFNKVVVEALAEGKPVTEYAPEADVSIEIRNIWNKISNLTI